MANQVYTFFVCVASGAISGVVYDLFYVIKRFISGKITEISLDILFFILFAGIYIFTSVLFGLPEFRFFMFIGCLLGLLLYLKSFHIMLDFFINMLYNVKIKTKGGCNVQRNVQ